MGLLKDSFIRGIRIGFFTVIWKRHEYQDWLCQAGVIINIWAWSIWVFPKTFPVWLKGEKSYPCSCFQDLKCIPASAERVKFPRNVTRRLKGDSRCKDFCGWCPLYIAECLKKYVVLVSICLRPSLTMIRNWFLDPKILAGTLLQLWSFSIASSPRSFSLFQTKSFCGFPPILITYKRPKLLPICKWIIFTSGWIRVNLKIPNLAAFSSSIFIWTFCLSVILGSPVFCPWQPAPSLYKRHLKSWPIKEKMRLLLVLSTTSTFLFTTEFPTSLLLVMLPVSLKLCFSADSRICLCCKDW